MSPALPKRRLLSWLVAVLLVTAPTPAIAASTPSPPVTFADEMLTEQRGDVAEIPVHLSDAEEATVRIGSGTDYVATVVVRDTDGDGRATVRLNTYDGTVTASEGDAVTVRERSNVSTPLATESYELDLWAGNGTDGERWDVTRLVVQHRSTDALRTWVAPGSANVTGLRDLRAAKASGTLGRSRVVSGRDTLVLELRASGLEGAIAGRRGSNATARFFTAFDGSVGNVTVQHLNPGASQQQAVLDLRNHTATTVVPDPDDDTYYLVVDLPDARMTTPDGEKLQWAELRSGEYRATVALSPASELSEGNESVTADFSIEPPTAHLDTPRGTRRAFVAPAADQTVAGTTSLAPGTDLTVRIYDEIGNVLGAKTVSVRNGTEGRNRFAATFDFGDFAPGRNFTVTVSVADGPMLLGSRTGQKGTQGVVAVRRASVNLTRRGLTESGVLVENATLSHGGYVAIHRGSAGGEVVARSERLAPGEEFGRFLDFDAALESNATLVAVAHRGGPGDALGEPYTENGSVVADSVEFSAARATGSDGTGTETTTETVTQTTVHTIDATTTTESEGTVPGFGVLSALVALLAVSLLARRIEE